MIINILKIIGLYTLLWVAAMILSEFLWWERLNWEFLEDGPREELLSDWRRDWHQKWPASALLFIAIAGIALWQDWTLSFSLRVGILAAYGYSILACVDSPKKGKHDRRRVCRKKRGLK